MAENKMKLLELIKFFFMGLVILIVLPIMILHEILVRKNK